MSIKWINESEEECKKYKNEYNLPPCEFCKNEIIGAQYIWVINLYSRKICCLNCKNKKSLQPVGYHL